MILEDSQEPIEAVGHQSKEDTGKQPPNLGSNAAGAGDLVVESLKQKIRELVVSLH
jgi:hypothetical protein